MKRRDRHRPVAGDAARISASSGVRSALMQECRGCGRSARRRNRRAGEEQRDAQQHAHGHAAPQKTELRVGLAEEFAERAESPRRPSQTSR